MMTGLEEERGEKEEEDKRRWLGWLVIRLSNFGSGVPTSLARLFRWGIIERLKNKKRKKNKIADAAE